MLSILNSKLNSLIFKVSLNMFYYDSLQLIVLTFLNKQYMIYLFFFFFRFPNIGEMRVKVELLHQQLWFSVTFSHWNTPNKDPNKTVPAIFFFSNIFWIISLWLFSFKMWFWNPSKYCNKTRNSLESGHSKEKRANFCAAVCWKYVCKFYSWLFTPFPYWSSSSAHHLEIFP